MKIQWQKTDQYKQRLSLSQDCWKIMEII